MARTETGEEAYHLLRGLLMPFLERPEALGVLIELAARWDPESLEEIRGMIGEWVKSAQGLASRPNPRHGPPQMASRTLADLFFRQGHREEAERIYKSLLRKDPCDEDTLREYRERFPGGDGELHQGELLDSLQDMLRRIRQARAGRQGRGT